LSLSGRRKAIPSDKFEQPTNTKRLSVKSLCEKVPLPSKSFVRWTMTAALQPQPNQISAASQQKSETSLLQNNSHSPNNSITIGNPAKYLSQEQQNPRIGMSAHTSSQQTATSPWSLSPSEFFPHHHTQDTHTSHRTSRVTHNWTLGRMMVVLFFIFLSYNTSPVYSLPLAGDFQELTSISHQPELKESEEGVALVRDMGRGRDGGERESQRDGNYVVQPQSQLYPHTPEIGEENEMRFEDQQMSRENVERTPQHQQQHHLQRLQVRI
jgi:hypothetical protein